MIISKEIVKVSSTKLEKIIEKYNDCLLSKQDLIGDNNQDMSKLFYLINKRFLYLLDNNPNIAITEKDIEIRKKINKILQKYGHLALKCEQKIENRNFVNNPHKKDIEEDKGIILSKKPVIFVANHGFRDDILATVLAAKRHAYVYLGSLPEFYNTTNGIALYLVGDVIFNRKIKESKQASLEKVKRLMELGTDLIIFPEGGWNKSINELTLPLWHGIYKMSKMNNYDVVPIVHYIRDSELLEKKNTIHTIIDEPIHLYEMNEKEALTYLRDIISSWQYKLMELYGKSTRERELKGFLNSREAWDYKLKERMKCVERYDSSIETICDFRDKEIIRPEEVFKPIANIENINIENVKSVIESKRLVKELRQNDFQRRY